MKTRDVLPIGLLVLLLLVVLSACSRMAGEAPESISAQALDVGCNVDDLIDAINDANSNLGADVINLEASCTYSLTESHNNTDGANGLPSISSEITINGNGATIRRESDNNFRIFHIGASGNLNLDGLAISGGSTTFSGGGIYNAGTLTVTNSTFSENSASFGGGINNHSSGTLTVTNSTFSGNSAGDGGGIYNFSNALITVTNSTFSENSATNRGGGIRNLGALNLTNSIVALNTASTDPDILGGVSTASHNLIGNIAGSSGITDGVNGNIVTATPGLDPAGLQDNGGPTQTIALVADSPAVDAAHSASCPETDQRGVSRPQGNGCDIGAFELAVVEVEPPPAVSPQGPGYWRNNQAHTADLLPQGLGSYSVDTFAKARAVFNRMNCGRNQPNDAVGCLAAHLLTAKLNVANGADSCIDETIAAADSFLKSPNINYIGPSGKYSLSRDQRQTAISLKDTLDAYNKGLGCP